MNLEIINRKKFGKFINTFILKNTPLNTQQVKEEIPKELENILKCK